MWERPVGNFRGEILYIYIVFILMCVGAHACHGMPMEVSCGSTFFPSTVCILGLLQVVRPGEKHLCTDLSCWLCNNLRGNK